MGADTSDTVTGQAVEGPAAKDATIESEAIKDGDGVRVDRLSTARGVLLGLVLATVFWGAVALVVHYLF